MRLADEKAESVTARSCPKGASASTTHFHVADRPHISPRQSHYILQRLPCTMSVPSKQQPEETALSRP